MQNSVIAACARKLFWHSDNFKLIELADHANGYQLADQCLIVRPVTGCNIAAPIGQGSEFGIATEY